MEFVMPVTGFFCKLCAKFYDNAKTNKERHCSTSQHKTKAAVSNPFISPFISYVVITPRSVCIPVGAHTNMPK